jgi:PAS domain S-box-containing protein
MSTDPVDSSQPLKQLRQSAEESLLNKPAAKRDRPTSVKSNARLVEELRVHQVELQMQNEELINARNNAEQAAARYTELYDFAPVGYISLNHSGYITQANLSGARLLGVERNRLIGKRLTAFATQGALPALHDFLRQTLTGHVPANYQLKLRDHCLASIVQIEAGLSHDGLELRVVLTDISQRVAAETSMRQFAHIISSSTDMLALVDQTYTYLSANRAYLQTYQVRLDHLIGKTVAEVFGSEAFEQIIKPHADLCLTGKKINVQTWFDFPDKPKRYMDVTYSPFIDADNQVQGFTISARDITDQHKIEKELFNVKKLESIGVLAGGIAHDFNNVLAILFGNIGLASMKIPPEHDAHPHIECAYQALERATSLTKQLLTFAKGGDPVITAVNIKAIICDVISFNLSGSNIKMVMNIPDNLWQVKVDKGQISQVLSNLTLNAKQAMPDGGNLYIEANNIHDITKDMDYDIADDCVKITLRDEGIGIPTEHIDKIFDPYFTTKESGNGLGLAIVRSIVAKHNGHLTINSIPGIGSTFTLYLPAKTTTPEIINKMQLGMLATSPSKLGRVLIMDDEEEIRRMLQEMLTLCGYSSESAIDGEQAIAKYVKAANSGNAFDVVIMDLTIPGGVGGKQAIKQLIEIDPNAKVMVASGYSMDHVIANFSDHGFKGRLIKPFRVNDLKQELARIMALP